MKITERFFQMDSEWNVVHLPYKPNGFLVFIFGDRNHFVGEDSSFWLQHYGRNQLLTSLRNKGYTLVNSNLFGRHWGSEKAVAYAKQLIHYVFKQEILNEKFIYWRKAQGPSLQMSSFARSRTKYVLQRWLILASIFRLIINEKKKTSFSTNSLLKKLPKATELRSGRQPIIRSKAYPLITISYPFIFGKD